MWIILSLFGCFVLAGLIRKFASHTLVNGFMSKEQAEDVFPEWRKQKKENGEVLGQNKKNKHRKVILSSPDWSYFLFPCKEFWRPFSLLHELTSNSAKNWFQKHLELSH